MGCIIGGTSEFWEIFGGFIWLARDWICIPLLVSKLVLLVEFQEMGCCMVCVGLIALTELDDGMLEVSAQCGSCHQFNILISMPLKFLPFPYAFGLLILSPCLLLLVYVFWFIGSILHIILHCV